MYREVERGRFEAGLIRDDVLIAFTDCDCVRLDKGYTTSDKKAVEDFADSYDLPVAW